MLTFFALLIMSRFLTLPRIPYFKTLIFCLSRQLSSVIKQNYQKRLLRRSFEISAQVQMPTSTSFSAFFLHHSVQIQKMGSRMIAEAKTVVRRQQVSCQWITLPFILILRVRQYSRVLNFKRLLILILISSGVPSINKMELSELQRGENSDRSRFILQQRSLMDEPYSIFQSYSQNVNYHQI